MYLIKIRNYAKLRVVASLLESQAHERKQMFGTIYALLFYCILLEEENHQEQIVEAVHHIIEICQPDGIMQSYWKLERMYFFMQRQLEMEKAETAAGGASRL